MRVFRAIVLAPVLIVLSAGVAFAQTPIDPSVSPELNTGGWVHGMAILLGIVGLIVILLLVAGYIRFAPRFATDESTLKVVRADRVRPGQELPRRTVDIKAAVPVVVAPPPLPQPAGVSAAPAVAAAPAPAPATPAQAGPGAEAPSTEAPRAEPASEAAPSEADAATETRETPAAEASAPAPAPAAHAEVSLDQEVFDRTLKELLDKGTDKRVAEGQARRAAMIAARKKAAGEA
ncbi:MAG TPA: hypothetical protein VFW51_05265 [Actinomycetota bacterium]|nr:hypothetical protein [Actinomycetota bacterium]